MPLSFCKLYNSCYHRYATLVANSSAWCNIFYPRGSTFTSMAEGTFVLPAETVEQPHNLSARLIPPLLSFPASFASCVTVDIQDWIVRVHGYFSPLSSRGACNIVPREDSGSRNISNLRGESGHAKVTGEMVAVNFTVARYSFRSRNSSFAAVTVHFGSPCREARLRWVPLPISLSSTEKCDTAVLSYERIGRVEIVHDQ